LYATDSLAGTQTICIKQSPNGIGNAIVTMIDTRPEDYYIAVATHGNGVYSANIASAWQITSAKAPQSSRFNVYPNPVTEKTCIIQTEFTLSETASVTLYNIEGKLMALPKILAIDQTHYQLSLPTLPAGYYFVRLKDKTQSSVQKILVE
jgi:hypothetical protein